MSTPIPTPQRWERPFNFPPGFWKRQLPTKVLELAVRGDVDALRQLLEEHPKFLNQRGAHNRTLLWEAARRGKLAAVQWLVERGAEVDATGCYNSESYVQITPYCAAIYYHRAGIPAYLLSQGAQLDIFRATFLGDQPLVSRHLAARPDLLLADDPHDAIYFTPLLAFAVAGGHLPVADFLLRQGAPVPAYSAQLLFLAARVSRMDLIELLMAHGAEVPAVDSGIYVAVEDLTIIRYLLDHGAPAAQPGKNGFPALVYLARGDKGEHPEKMQALLEHGAQVNAAGPKGRTALHYAAVADHSRVIALLLDHGADPTLEDEQGETAMSLARAAGKTAAAALLSRRGHR